jgi:hypothetical protein
MLPEGIAEPDIEGRALMEEPTPDVVLLVPTVDCSDAMKPE